MKRLLKIANENMAEKFFSICSKDVIVSNETPSYLSYETEGENGEGYFGVLMKANKSDLTNDEESFIEIVKALESSEKKAEEISKKLINRENQSCDKVEYTVDEDHNLLTVYVGLTFLA